jgi:hypothetical protein
MNTSQLTPFLQTVRPSKLSNNSVVASGVVQLGGKYACITQAPTDVYWFIDPYAFGSVQSLLNASEIRQLYGNRVNLTVKIILGDDTQRIGSSVGLFNAAYLSKYVLCASQQRNFSAFTARLNSAYNSSYLSQSVLAGISNSSKLDYAQLNQCLASSSTEINVQSLLAQYYNITQTPIAIVNCHYLALPQTVRQALCYTNSTLC